MTVSIAFAFAGPFAKLLFTADGIYRPRWRFFPQGGPGCLSSGYLGGIATRSRSPSTHRLGTP